MGPSPPGAEPRSRCFLPCLELLPLQSGLGFLETVMGRASRDLYTPKTERGQGRRRRGRVAGDRANSQQIQRGRRVQWVTAPSRFTSWNAEPSRVSSIQPPLAVICRQSSLLPRGWISTGSIQQGETGTSGERGTAERSPRCSSPGPQAERSALPAPLLLVPLHPAARGDWCTRPLSVLPPTKKVVGLFCTKVQKNPKQNKTKKQAITAYSSKARNQSPRKGGTFQQQMKLSAASGHDSSGDKSSSCPSSLHFCNPAADDTSFLLHMRELCC